MTGWEGGIAQDKEELWEYDIPPLAEAITTIVVRLDGAYALMRDDGYREAMVGNISLYDVTGKRQHTVYIGEALEYGKGTFFHTVLQLMVGAAGQGIDHFSFHDLKSKGISETSGDKQTASGHKTHAMVAVYDRKLAEVKSAGEK